MKKILLNILLSDIFIIHHIYQRSFLIFLIIISPFFLRHFFLCLFQLLCSHFSLMWIHFFFFIWYFWVISFHKIFLKIALLYFSWIFFFLNLFLKFRIFRHLFFLDFLYAWPHYLDFVFGITDYSYQFILVEAKMLFLVHSMEKFLKIILEDLT